MSSPNFQPNVSGGRVNPDPVLPAPSTSSVNTNVPLVAPGQPDQAGLDTGLMELARSIGSVDFGAITRAFTMKNEASRKLQEERDQAAGQAAASLALTRGVRDYEKLINSNIVPVNASPFFKTGLGIAVAQSALSDLRDAVAERRIKNPEAGSFMKDQEFLAPFFQRLNKAPAEAVVSQFINPMTELDKDDAVNRLKVTAVQESETLIRNVGSTLAGGIRRGDNINGQLNNAINILRESHHLNNSTIETIGLSLVPSIVSLATKPDGSIEPVKAGRLLTDLFNAKLDGFQGKTFGESFGTEFTKIQAAVNSSIFQATQAATQAYTAKQMTVKQDAQSWLVDNSRDDGVGGKVLPPIGKFINHVKSGGGEIDDAIEMWTAFERVSGNKGEAQEQLDKRKAGFKELLGTQSHEQLRELRGGIMARAASGEINYDEAFDQISQIDAELKTAPKTGVRDEDRGVYKQAAQDLSLTLNLSKEIGAAINRTFGTNRRVGFDSQPTIIRGITDAISEVIEAKVINTGLSSYRSSLDQIETNPLAPKTELTRLTDTVMATERSTLQGRIRDIIRTSHPEDVVTKIRQLKVHQDEPQSTVPARPQQSRTVPQRSVPQRSTSPSAQVPTKAATPKVWDSLKTFKSAATTSNSEMFRWFKSEFKNHKLTKDWSDDQILRFLKSQSPERMEDARQRYIRRISK